MSGTDCKTSFRRLCVNSIPQCTFSISILSLLMRMHNIFQGCYTKLKNYVEDKIVVVGGIGIGFAFVQVRHVDIHVHLHRQV